VIHLAYIDPGSIYTVSTGMAAVLAFLVSFLAFVGVFFRRVWGFFKHHWGKVAIALAIVAAVVAFVALRQGEQVGGGMSGKGRFIIVALDGLSPEIVEPMLAAGKLPSFQRLKDMGGYSRIATTNPAESPVAWCTVATGRNPGKHGMYDFIRRKPGTYLPDLSLTRIEGNRSMPVRKGKAFWQYGREAGVPMVMLAFPVTFPPDEVNGVMLSGMGTPDLLGTQGTFSYYTTAPESVTADTGGEVHAVGDANPLRLELLGPRKQGLTGTVERLAAPFEVRVDRAAGRATISLQGQEASLAVGQWSSWLDVQFKVGALRRMHGIVRFNLTSLTPHVGLYASPICIDPRSPWFPISYPGEYAGRLARELGLYSTRGMPFDTWALNEGRLSEEAFIEDAQGLFFERLRLMQHELARTESGVFFCYFEYPDIIQHMYWRFVDHQHPLYRTDVPARVSGMIEDCYLKMDQVVGQALAAMRPNDVLVVLSDHGFTTFRRMMHVNSWLRANGYQALRNEYADEGGPLFADVDWSKTRAYALGFGGIYLNRQGREPDGMVAPGEETEALKREIAGKLRGFADPDTGARVLHSVYLQQEIFRGPEAPQAPDLYLGFETGYGASWQTALGAAPKGLMEDNLKKWSGSHLVDPSLVPGILFASKRLVVADPSLYDIAPTVLRFIGFADSRIAAEDIDGRPLF
jgi:predicted AlkP superfamily phosphohydrolase/phosphomutase